MSCAHEAWERDTASEADGLCPLCLRASLDLVERRLASSEELRTGLALKIERLQKALEPFARLAVFDPPPSVDSKEWFDMMMAARSVAFGHHTTHT